MAVSMFRSSTAHGMRDEIGRRLARLRLARNVTQDALAADAGVSVRTLRRLEAGQPSSLDSFLRIAIALELADELVHALPASDIRPIERMDSRGTERQRARPPNVKASTAPWTWSEETRD